MRSVIVSTFELLVRPIISSPNAPNRTVIQGYFLTIANPTFDSYDLQIRLRNTTGSSSSPPLVAFWDVDGTNQEVAPSFGNSFFRVNLPGADTGLFLIQPDIRDSRVVASSNIEFRGFIELSIVSATRGFFTGTPTGTLVLTPTQRGTFLPQGSTFPPAEGDYDHIAYSLPIESPIVTLEPSSIIRTISTPIERAEIVEAIRGEPELLLNFTDDPLAEQLVKIENADERSRMLEIFLERFQNSDLIPRADLGLPNGQGINIRQAVDA